VSERFKKVFSGKRSFVRYVYGKIRAAPPVRKFILSDRLKKDFFAYLRIKYKYRLTGGRSHWHRHGKSGRLAIAPAV
jgi:hypothetical protein